MLLVIGHSKAARQTLRNACRSHPDVTVRRFGRAALLAETHLGAFLACRLREKYGTEVEVERTRPLNEFEDVPEEVRAAARAYEARDHPSTPYAKFAAGTDHPDPEDLQGADL